MSLCSRAALERLVVAKIRAKEPLTAQEIEVLLQGEQQTSEAKKVVRDADAPRSGGGYFDALDDESLLTILNLLPFDERLQMCINVCKSFRAFRSSTELWRCLRIKANSMPNTPYFQARTPGAVPAGRTGVQRLLDFVPDRSAITDLRIYSRHSQQVHGSTLEAPEIKRVLTALPGLQHLELTGRAISSPVLEYAAKQPWITSLTSICLDLSSQSGVAMKLLKKATAVETLGGSPGLEIGALSALAMAWKDARGGASPLLNNLQIRHLPSDALSIIGTSFPELTTLSTHSLGMQYLERESFTAPVATWRLRATVSVAPMPRLRTLHVEQLCFRDPLSTQDLSTVLSALLAACPSLEDIRLHRADSPGTRTQQDLLTPVPPPYCLTTRAVSALAADGALDSKGWEHVRDRNLVAAARERWSRLPGADGALAHLPASVTALDLGQIWLEPDALSSAVLPNLRLLRLLSCGSAAPAIAAEWKRHRPKVRVAVLDEQTTSL